MHPSSGLLVSFCDAETAAWQTRRIARHLAKCGRCRERAERIRREKEDLLAGKRSGANPAGLAGILSAAAAWREGRSAAATQLRRRLDEEIDTYCGAAAVGVIDEPGTRADQLLVKSCELFEVFLGPAAAEAVRDEVLQDLDWALPAEEADA